MSGVHTGLPVCTAAADEHVLVFGVDGAAEKKVSHPT